MSNVTIGYCSNSIDIKVSCGNFEINEELWNAVLAILNKYNDLYKLNMVIESSEYERCFRRIKAVFVVSDYIPLIVAEIYKHSVQTIDIVKIFHLKDIFCENMETEMKQETLKPEIETNITKPTIFVNSNESFTVYSTYGLKSDMNVHFRQPYIEELFKSINGLPVYRQSIVKDDESNVSDVIFLNIKDSDEVINFHLQLINRLREIGYTVELNHPDAFVKNNIIDIFEERYSLSINLKYTNISDKIIGYLDIFNGAVTSVKKVDDKVFVISIDGDKIKNVDEVKESIINSICCLLKDEFVYFNKMDGRGYKEFLVKHKDYTTTHLIKAFHKEYK